MTVRAVIIEDEPHARVSLREYAADVPWLTVVGEAADGAEAVRLIDALHPDLMFLDICLPEASGLEVLERVRHKPDVVFTTAHEQYALAAFEIGALDYLSRRRRGSRAGCVRQAAASIVRADARRHRADRGGDDPPHLRVR